MLSDDNDVKLWFASGLVTLMLASGAHAQSCAFEHAFAAGISVGAAGDVNGDSVPDIIVGNPLCTGKWCSTAQDRRGHAYVYSGKDYSLLYTFTGWVLPAPHNNQGSNLGQSVAGAGDVNRDGFDDVIVGIRMGTKLQTSLSGRARVYSGKDGALLYDFHPGAAGDAFGNSVAKAGDVNGDGYPDLIVGAPTHNPIMGDWTMPDTGLAYVFSGRDGALLYRLSGEHESDLFGYSVAGLGDVNGDGYDDFAVGAPWHTVPAVPPNAGVVGRVYVYSGRNGTILYVTDDVFGPLPEAMTPWYGVAIAPAGDVNGDTIPDLVVGAMQTKYPGTPSLEAGAVFVYSGRDGALLHHLVARPGDFWFGYSVAGAGDLNRDGFDDVLLGSAQSRIGNQIIGRAYLYSGRTGEVLQTIAGDKVGAGFGISVAGVGDLNNDGIPELLIGERKRSSRLYSCTCGDDMDFRASTDGWRFSNTQANMWPKTWWEQFDYTDGAYPVWLRGWAKSSDFPSWLRFADAFGRDQCYWNTSPGTETFRLKSLMRWMGIKGEWGGSCFGFATSSLLYFDDSLNLWSDYPGYLYANDVPLGDEIRKTLNTYWIHQFGKVDLEWTRIHRKDRPKKTLAECAKMFCDPQNPHRALTLYNNNGQGGHTIVPYRIAPDSDYVHAVDIFVYDNNYPGVDTLKIIVDTIDDLWLYPPLRGWGGSRYLMLENPVGEYMTSPVLTGPSPRSDTPVKMAAGATGATEFIECYISPSDTVLIESPYGSVGHAGDSAFNSLSEGFPITPKTGRETPPVGYYIPKGDWSVRTRGRVHNRLRMTFLSDVSALAYSRDSVLVGDIDRLRYQGNDDGLCIYNPNGNAWRYNIEILSIAADSELFCRLTGMVLGLSDSARFVPKTGGRVLISNYGPATTYDLDVAVVSATVDTTFYHGGIPIPANTAHDIHLDWRSSRDAVMVLADSGMYGAFADTLWFDNLGKLPCPCICIADPACDGVVDVLDITEVIDVAFRMVPITPDPSPLCTFYPTDVDCDGYTNLIDVVKLVEVVFRGGDPTVMLCSSCSP